MDIESSFTKPNSSSVTKMDENLKAALIEHNFQYPEQLYQYLVSD